MIKIIIFKATLFLIIILFTECSGEKDNKINYFQEMIQEAPLDGGLRMENYWVWGGCPIKGEDGNYHLFVSRWKKDMPFFIGYIFQSEIVRAVSKTPEGPYKFEEVVLPVRGQSYWDGMMTHNPTIRKVDDKYLLFYIGATYDFEKPVIPPGTHDQEISKEIHEMRNKVYKTIRIGMAYSSSVYGPWTRLDKPVLDVRPSHWDSSIVTNPAPFIHPDGSIYLVYRSNTPTGLRLGLARTEKYTLPFERIANEPLFNFSKDKFCEDPFIWHNGDFFEVIMKDMTGEITGEKHAGVHGFSNDGIHWEISQNPKAYSRKIIWENGDTTKQGSFERPQLLLDEHGKPTHLFAATGDGLGGFRNAKNTWCMVIPLLDEK